MELRHRLDRKRQTCASSTKSVQKARKKKINQKNIVTNILQCTVSEITPRTTLPMIPCYVCELGGVMLLCRMDELTDICDFRRQLLVRFSKYLLLQEVRRCCLVDMSLRMSGEISDLFFLFLMRNGKKC